MGYSRTYVDLFGKPDAAAFELRGEKALRDWGTDSAALNATFKQQVPDLDAVWGSAQPGCLSDGATRSRYKSMTGAIANTLGKISFANCLEKAKAAFELRSGARHQSREEMCDRAEIKVLKERDISEYGTAKPSFAYMVGKYATRAAEKCKTTVCDLMSTTCDAMITGAQKTNKFYNFFAKYLG